jgi:hypothetical protein
LKVVQLQVNNLLSYNITQKLQFANYTLIVGPNASGKTNLARILSFIREPRNSINEKRLPLGMKFDHERPSHLQIDIQLNKEEMRILIELMFDKIINTHDYDSNMTMLSVFLEWTNRFEEKVPSSAILYFYNYFIVWADGLYLNASYVTSLENIDNIKSDIAKAIDIDKEKELKERYHEQKGFFASELFNQHEFQDRLIQGDRCSGKKLRDFFEIDSKRIRIKIQPFIVTYNSDRIDDQNAHAVRILNYLGRKIPTADSANLWLVISHFLITLILLLVAIFSVATNSPLSASTGYTYPDDASEEEKQEIDEIEQEAWEDAGRPGEIDDPEEEAENADENDESTVYDDNPDLDGDGVTTPEEYQKFTDAAVALADRLAESEEELIICSDGFTKVQDEDDCPKSTFIHDLTLFIH